MKITYMRYATVQGATLYAILKDGHYDMQVDVPDQSPQALRNVALEMRAKVVRELKRIEFIEAAAAQLEGANVTLGVDMSAGTPPHTILKGWDKV